MFEDIKDKVVLITGATGAIGNTIAELFALYGCKLVLTGRKADILKEVHAKCEKIAKQSANVINM
ncbi:putative oxidoreductase-like protein [Leptotrombidium deliense]|uniref:Putative oxidoreductase-like protein n=1 Tax=Leptotrombidium deliense TaxID=299467 RepID=A0A443SPI2_9ACAR|nr:putative oxidoreductase-like protein [Leptotrombidium deliense]